MANGKIPNFNNKFYGDKLVEVTFPDSTGSLGFDEYNAVLNNANSSITSSKIMNADYALNARIPTNNDRLISGTAQRMEIQDSNYSSVAWTSPRYVGSKTISATYNDYQASGSSVTFADGTTGTWKGDQVFDEYPGDSTFTRGNPLGKVPAIDLYSTHFVLFDRIQIDEAFADGDIFHCLYLIDDQGNKQPLTYRNKNLVDLQRIFVKGSNAEVLFLGQNNQEVLDEYPIIEVGKITSTRASFTNDIFKLNGTDYEPNFIATETAASNAYIRHTFINDRQTDYTVRFVPSAFNIENEGNGIYKLTYSNTDIRNSIINNINFNEQLAFRHWCFRRAKISSNPTATTYDFFDGSSSLNMQPQNHDSKFDPFYFLTYNPQTSKIFEGTLLEQQVDWNLYTPDPYTQIPWFITVPGYPGINTTSIGSVSQYTNEWSPIKINDEIVFNKFPILQQTETSLIGTPPPNGTTSNEEVINNFREYYEPSNLVSLQITEINYPFSQSYESIRFAQIFSRGGGFTFYDNDGNITQQSTPTLGFTWVGQRQQTLGDNYTSIRNNISPSQTTFPDNTVVHGSNGWGKISLFVDDDTYSISFGDTPRTPTPGVFGMIMSIYDYSTIDRSSFLESLSHGDIIEFDVMVPGTNLSSDGQGIARYQILQKPFYASFNTPSNNGYHLVFRLQYIPTEGGRNNIETGIEYNYMNDFGKNIFIKRIIKYRAPYIRAKISNAITNTQIDISGSINSSGSVLSVVGVNTHEQYITSQFLEGSGVGALIPENYDPKLREQLPDIINKTGIDINSLT